MAPDPTAHPPDEEFALVSVDGLRLHAQCWRARETPRGTVLLVHGFAEHIGRFGHVAYALTQSGYTVYGLDHRTHGRSAGQPRVHVVEPERLADDLALLWARLRCQHPSRPAFVYGHSMGAYFALLFALRQPDGLAGVITSGAPLTMDTAIGPFFRVLGQLLGRALPHLPLVPLALDAISRDPQVVAAYQADPLVHAGRVRAGMAARVARALADLRLRLADFETPLLILHGADDRVVPPAGSLWLHAHVRSRDKTLRLYPGLYHEIHNEPERDQVFAEVLAWLNARVATVATA